MATLGRYHVAVAAIKKGLELEPDWARSDFRLTELYGNNEAAKATVLDALTTAAEQEPNNADLQFLLGVHLYFDGKPEQAAPLFERTRELAGGEKGFLEGFGRE